MNTATKRSLVVIACLSLAVTGLLASCGRSHHGHGRFNPEKTQKFVTRKVNDTLDDLEADQTQRQKIHEIKDRILAKVVGMRASHRSTHKVFLEELGKDRPDSKRLHGLLDERLDSLREKAHEGLDAVLEVHAILTPEQRIQLRKKIEDHKGGCLGSN